MAKTLVIAEKPSVARDLARVLGVRGAGKHAIEGSGRVITWCIGHLVELEEPAAYDDAWKRWRLDSLPMLPARFLLRPSRGTLAQWRVVRSGNSGGPMVDGRGRVVTTVFAATTSGPRGGFGVPNSVTKQVLASARGPVHTGPCAR